MRFNPAPARKAARKARKLIPGAVKKKHAKKAPKAAKKRVKPKHPATLIPGGPMRRVPGPRPSPAAG